MWFQRAQHKSCLQMTLLAWEALLPLYHITVSWFLYMEWFRHLAIDELSSFHGIPLTASCIENTGEAHHAWQNIGRLLEISRCLPSGRCSSLPTPGGHPACLPDEEVFAPRWNRWAPGVSIDLSKNDAVILHCYTFLPPSWSPVMQSTCCQRCRCSASTCCWWCLQSRTRSSAAASTWTVSTHCWCSWRNAWSR